LEEVIAVSIRPGFELKDTGATPKQKAVAEGQWLKMQREKLDWSVEEMARKLQVSPHEYQMYENGDLGKLADYDFDEIKYYMDHQVRTRGKGRIKIDGFER